MDVVDAPTRREVVAMVTTESGPAVIGQTANDRVRPARIVMVLLVVLAIAAGWWILAARSSDGDAEALVVDYLAAWDAGDGEAVVALMTDDGVHTCPLGTFSVDDDRAALIAAVRSMEGDDFVVVDGPIVSQSAPPLEAVAWVRIETPASDALGLATYRIVREDGELLISRSLFEHR